MRTHTVYGIRLAGDPEVRYIGLTYKRIERRLSEHRRTPSCPGLTPWVAENWDRVEVFAIASVDNEREARATEKVLIALCARLNHRLFNRAHMPGYARRSGMRSLCHHEGASRS